MPDGNILKYGLLRTRDLVELYYGARMVAQQLPLVIFRTSSGNPTQLIPVDPRRFALRVYMSNFGGVAAQVFIGYNADSTSTNSMQFDIPLGATVTFARNFLTDLEAVTNELWFLVQSSTALIQVEQFILTPAPVDEVPLG